MKLVIYYDEFLAAPKSGDIVIVGSLRWELWRLLVGVGSFGSDRECSCNSFREVSCIKIDEETLIKSCVSIGKFYDNFLDLSGGSGGASTNGTEW